MGKEDSLPLSGPWSFRLSENDPWQAIPVPGCWEALGIRKDHPGPAWYRKQVRVPESFAGRRVWLCLDGVSYHCTATVNGRAVGSHTGSWDAFRFDISDAITPGQMAEIRIQVEKPAGLTGGPDSAAVPGRFPLKETLSGFLPYVWGHIFGGLWQAARLEATGPVVFEELTVWGDAGGHFRAEVRCSDQATLSLHLFDPAGDLVFSQAQTGRTLHVETTLAEPALWSPEAPNLYRARVAIADGESRTVPVGFRALRVANKTLLLNEQPLYPRLILSWGWYPQSLHSNPGPAQVRRDFERLKQLGYNGVKLCLWVPPQYYFDLADELGLLLWLELPMWLPAVTPFFRRQTPIEYERIVRQVRHHPALILYSLGCELDREVDAGLLETLYSRIKPLIGDALLRDNSGSGEAYGGLLNEFADYYDYHFYSDLQFLRPLLDAFSPRWRPVQPWFFGEFCDLDTLRDLAELTAAHDGQSPWWTRRDETLNPQGARWQFDLVDQEARLRASGFWERAAELKAISHRQALLHRKVTLELVRTYRAVSGYVVTGERDTPISTAGMWDDLEQFKFEPDAFRAFNQDLVLALGWDKRRAWQAGGDRVAHWDPYCYRAGERVRAHLILSHYGRTAGPVDLTWAVSLPGQPPLAGEIVRSKTRVAPGTVREVHIAEFVAPTASEPAQASLSASVTVGEQTTVNRWDVWFFPPPLWPAETPCTLFDPLGRLAGLADVVPLESGPPTPARVLVTTAWTPEIAALIEAGGRAILLQTEPEPAGPLPTAAMPFWREAVKVIEPHPAWGDFPHEGWVNRQFYGLATAHALLPQPAITARPLLRRLDARTMALHDYATELSLGRGQVIVSTLRFGGGLGDQPSGIAANPAALYLLGCWVRYLGEVE